MDSKDIEFFKNFTWVLVALAAIAIVAGIVASNVAGESDRGPLFTEEAIKERIEPVAKVWMTGDAAPEAKAAAAVAATAEASAAPTTAEEIIAASCAACHLAGIANAPKLGDRAAWGARAAKGLDKLVENAIKGFNGMPPKGGAMHLSDEQIREAVAKMVKDAGL